MNLYPETITFEYCLTCSEVKVVLMAEVKKENSRDSYIVKNLRTARFQGRLIVPEMILKKVDGQWVHGDSGKETDLCAAIGTEIDKYSI